MKLVKLKILDSALREAIGGDFAVCLYDGANILHLIRKIDDCRKGKFFIRNYPEFRSLLHMVWNPVEKRFYKQIAISAYNNSNAFFEVRKKPTVVLPDQLTVFLGLGLCKSEGEDIVDFQTFQSMMHKSQADEQT